MVCYSPIMLHAFRLPIKNRATLNFNLLLQPQKRPIFVISVTMILDLNNFVFSSVFWFFVQDVVGFLPILVDFLYLFLALEQQGKMALFSSNLHLLSLCFLPPKIHHLRLHFLSSHATGWSNVHWAALRLRHLHVSQQLGASPPRAFTASDSFSSSYALMDSKYCSNH